MSNTISSSLNDAVVSAAALEAFTAGLTPLNAFSTDFSNEAGKRGASVSVPLIGAGSTADFAGDYTTGSDSTINSVTVTLNKHKYITWHLTDVEFSKSSALNIEQEARENGAKLAADVLADIWSVVTAANYSSAAFTGAYSTFTTDGVVAIKQACDTALMPTTGRSLILDSTFVNNMLLDSGIADAAAFGGSEVIREATIPRLFGFNVYQSTLIPSNSEFLKGFACVKSSVALAMRYLQPQLAGQPVYLETMPISDPASGITIGYRRYGDPKTGKHYVTLEAFYGFSKGVAAGLKRVVSA